MLSPIEVMKNGHEKWGRWFESPASQFFFFLFFFFFSRIDDSHSDLIPLTANHCSNNGYAVKNQVSWKEYCVEYCQRNSRNSWIGALTAVI